MNRSKQLGFTLVEILVVLSIIAILIGLLYPALRGGIARAKKTTELNKIRQVGNAWSLYSVSNRDRLMPGYISAAVQERWDVAWAYPDETLVPPSPHFEDDAPNVAGPWPWRILDRMDYSWEMLIDYKSQNWPVEQLVEHAEVVAQEPAFGYNGYYIGGFWETSGHFDVPTLKYSQVLLENNQVDNVVARIGSQITKPTETVVFCSSFYAQQGEYRDMPNDTVGSYLAVPRILANVTQWKPTAEGIKVFSETSPPLGRYNAMPAIYFADGHVDDVSIYDLADQSMWIPRARDLPNTPAYDFSHSE